MRQPRLVPMVIVATSALLALKVLALAQGNVRALAAGPQVTAPADPFAGKPIDPIITNSGGGGGHGEEAPKPAASAGGGEHATPSDVKTTVSPAKPVEAKPIPGSELLSEVEILKRLAERRKQLDKLEEDLMMRENLLKAAEDRVGKRVDELKAIETKNAATGKQPEDEQKKQLSDLVKMYESMKPKDAARVFDGLDLKLLTDISRQMNPKKLGDVVAKMTPEVAQKLTVELGRNGISIAAPAPAPAAPTDLPKIQGKS